MKPRDKQRANKKPGKGKPLHYKDPTGDEAVKRVLKGGKTIKKKTTCLLGCGSLPVRTGSALTWRKKHCRKRLTFLPVLY